MVYKNSVINLARFILILKYILLSLISLSDMQIGSNNKQTGGKLHFDFTNNKFFFHIFQSGVSSAW